MGPVLVSDYLSIYSESEGYSWMGVVPMWQLDFDEKEVRNANKACDHRFITSEDRWS